MILKLPLLFKGSKGEKKLYALFDSGSAYSCIREDLALEICDLKQLADSLLCTTAASNQFLEIQFEVEMVFELNDLHLKDEFMVVPDLSEEVIIGTATMQRWRIKLDFDREIVITTPVITNSY